jgi:hypothetical protein
LGRRDADQLEDHAPGGSPMHGLLDWEVAAVVRLFEEWAQTDRSHRKLAHRGSYLERVWVLPASVRRVLERADPTRLHQHTTQDEYRSARIAVADRDRRPGHSGR